MNNEEVSPITEETIGKLSDSFNSINEAMVRMQRAAYDLCNQLVVWLYINITIPMLRYKRAEERFNGLSMIRPILRPYYRYRYRKSRMSRIKCQRDLIHLRIQNKDNEAIIAEFNRIDEIYQ